MIPLSVSWFSAAFFSKRGDLGTPSRTLLSLSPFPLSVSLTTKFMAGWHQTVCRAQAEGGSSDTTSTTPILNNPRKGVTLLQQLTDIPHHHTNPPPPIHTHEALQTPSPAHRPLEKQLMSARLLLSPPGLLRSCQLFHWLYLWEVSRKSQDGVVWSPRWTTFKPP